MQAVKPTLLGGKPWIRHTGAICAQCACMATTTLSDLSKAITKPRTGEHKTEQHHTVCYTCWHAMFLC
jgi:hypothetical protein